MIARRTVLLVAASLAVVPRPARAEGEAPATALFQKAREEAARGDWEHACPRFAESLRLVPATGTMLNLGDCEEHRGRLADALGQFEHALEALPARDERITYTRGRIITLRPRVPHVRLRALAAETIELDGVTLASASLGVDLPVNPGIRTIVAHASGHADRIYRVKVAEGATVDLAIEAGAPNASAPSAPVRPEPSARPSRTLAWTALGVGVAGLATMTISGILALHTAGVVKGACPGGVCTNRDDLDTASRGRTYTTISTVGLAVGVVGAAVATYLFLRDRSRHGTMAP